MNVFDCSCYYCEEAEAEAFYNRLYVRELIKERGWTRQVEASAEYEVELALDYLRRDRSNA